MRERGQEQQQVRGQVLAMAQGTEKDLLFLSQKKVPPYWILHLLPTKKHYLRRRCSNSFDRRAVEW